MHASGTYMPHAICCSRLRPPLARRSKLPLFLHIYTHMLDAGVDLLEPLRFPITGKSNRVSACPAPQGIILSSYLHASSAFTALRKRSAAEDGVLMPLGARLTQLVVAALLANAWRASRRTLEAPRLIPFSANPRASTRPDAPRPTAPRARKCREQCRVHFRRLLCSQRIAWT